MTVTENGARNVMVTDIIIIGGINTHAKDVKQQAENALPMQYMNIINQRRINMAGVYFCSHTNSTKFTECCQVAICDDETKCPLCKEEVPYTPRARHEMAMQKLYGSKKLAEMRKNYIKL
jgi:hypothetical protein